MSGPRTDRTAADPSGRAGAHGLTLVELMVSATLVVGVIGSAGLCLLTGRRAQDEAERRMEVVQSARVALDRLARDLAMACPLDPEFALLGMKRLRDGVEIDNIDFATHHWQPERPGEGDRCEVSYFVDSDPVTGDLALYRRRDPTPDAEPLEGGYREEIAVGVRALRLEYFDGALWQDEWGSIRSAAGALLGDSSRGGGQAGLPEAVRITLALAPPRRSAGVDAGAVSAAEADEEAPRVFRTVVRLVLAGREREAADEEAVGAAPAPAPEAEAPAGDAHEGSD
ncbi:MAG: hypothetical protein JXQ29_08560 [Planctomycetes bacterium]|nr:hypothetical protein [Planctomycetota bacterium]